MTQSTDSKQTERERGGGRGSRKTHLWCRPSHGHLTATGAVVLALHLARQPKVCNLGNVVLCQQHVSRCNVSVNKPCRGTSSKTEEEKHKAQPIVMSSERETERDRERDRQRDRQRERQRERDRQTERQRERQRDSETDRQRDRDRERHAHRHTHTQTHTHTHRSRYLSSARGPGQHKCHE